MGEKLVFHSKNCLINNKLVCWWFLINIGKAIFIPLNQLNDNMGEELVSYSKNYVTKRQKK